MTTPDSPASTSTSDVQTRILDELVRIRRGVNVLATVAVGSVCVTALAWFISMRTV